MCLGKVHCLAVLKEAYAVNSQELYVGFVSLPPASWLAIQSLQIPADLDLTVLEAVYLGQRH